MMTDPIDTILKKLRDSKSIGSDHHGAAWWWTNHLVTVGVLLAICAWHPLPARAQVVPWVITHVGDTGAYQYQTSFTYNGSASPPTYTVVGTGDGLNGIPDVETFVNTAASGNIEISGRLVSQSSTITNAFAGLMIRSTLASGATQASIGVSVNNSLQFIYKNAYLDNQTIVNGPAVSGPVFLKLASTPTSITGSYSTDNETWIPIGTFSEPAPILPRKYYAGFCVSDTSSTLYNTCVFDTVTYATQVPQPSSSLLAWYRSDVGVVSGGSGQGVSSWKDQSGNGLDASQSTSANQPTLSVNAINNGVLNSINFSGSNQCLSVPAGFNNLTQGASIFAVVQSANLSSSSSICAFGNASNSDAISVQTANANVAASVYNGTTGGTVTSSTNPLTNNYQLVELIYTPGTSGNSGNASIYVNGALQIQQSGLPQSMNNVQRSNNIIGAAIGQQNYFQGGIAEILFFSNPLSDTARHNLEAYALSKFGVGTAPTLDSPTFTPPPGNGVLATGNITIQQDQGAPCYYTIDGSLPNPPMGTWFSINPLAPVEGQVISAVASAPFFANSAITTTSYRFRDVTFGIPTTNMLLWLRADQLLSVSSAGSVSNWGDSSGNGNNASQTSPSSQPAVIANAINGLPSVQFNGSNSALQLAPGLASLANGVSIFVVAKTTSSATGAHIVDFGNGAASDNVLLQQTSSGSFSFTAYNGSAPSTVTTNSGLLNNQFQLLESTDTGSGMGTLYANGTQLAQSTQMGSLNNVSRALNFIGQASQGGSFYGGQIAEIIVYQSGISQTARLAVESYLAAKYQLYSLANSPAPIISTSSGSFPQPFQVSLEAPYPAQIFVTTDGTDPVPNVSPLYTKPLFVTYSQTIKAIAVVNGVSSTVSSASYSLDPIRWPAP